jgi:hypothetical protein
VVGLAFNPEMHKWELKATDWGRRPRYGILLIKPKLSHWSLGQMPSESEANSFFIAVQYEKVIALNSKRGHSQSKAVDLCFPGLLALGWQPF